LDDVRVSVVVGVGDVVRRKELGGIVLPRVLESPKLTRTRWPYRRQDAPSTIALNCQRVLADQSQDARLELGGPVQIVSRPSDQKSYSNRGFRLLRLACGVTGRSQIFWN
jgi:hypothetical protein